MTPRKVVAASGVLLAALAFAQGPDSISPDVRLPSGKSQRDELMRYEHRKAKEDSVELARLAGELRDELDNSDSNVLSLTTLKKTEEIEKLAKRIRGRLKRW